MTLPSGSTRGCDSNHGTRPSKSNILSRAPAHLHKRLTANDATTSLELSLQRSKKQNKH
jgi:hypothetical protein